MLKKISMGRVLSGTSPVNFGLSRGALVQIDFDRGCSSLRVGSLVSTLAGSNVVMDVFKEGDDYLILRTHKHYQRDDIVRVVQALQSMYYKMTTLPSECTNTLYAQYYLTGVYYKNDVVKYHSGGNKELRYSIPMSSELLKQWQTNMTDYERKRAEAEGYAAVSCELRAAQQYSVSKQKIAESMKESYESEIHYSKIIRWGLTGLMGVAAVVLIVLIIMAFTKKK